MTGIQPSVCYRTGTITRDDYDEAIQALVDARDGDPTQGCPVCADGGCAPNGCHHNPLVLARLWAAATSIYTCYHCLFVATDDDMARDHFGLDQEVPKCVREGIDAGADLLDLVEDIAETEYGNVNPWRELPDGQAFVTALKALRSDRAAGPIGVKDHLDRHNVPLARLAGTAPATDYRQVAAEQGTKLIRLTNALNILRDWSLDGDRYSPTVTSTLSAWIAGDMDRPIPWPACPFFDDWARTHGLCEVNGSIGFMIKAQVTPDPAISVEGLAERLSAYIDTFGEIDPENYSDRALCDDAMGCDMAGDPPKQRTT